MEEIIQAIKDLINEKYDEDKDMKGTSNWIKYKSLIYIAE